MFFRKVCFIAGSVSLFIGCNGTENFLDSENMISDSQDFLSTELAGAVSSPTIRKLDPLSGNAGSEVTILGKFQSVTSVRFGELEATSFTVAADGKSILAVAPAGVLTAPITVQDASTSVVSSQVFESLCDPTIQNEKSLVINEITVVEDPVRTSFSYANPDSGVWSFPFLITQMLPAGKTIDEFLHAWFDEWKNVSTLNGFAVGPRSAIDTIVNNWPKRDDGTFDLEKSPFRLLAITNRMDLRSDTNAGEGRFVFGIVDSINGIQQFTVILEYKLPLVKNETLGGWTQRWHDLSLEQIPSEKYNKKLASITRRFATQRFNGIFTNGNAIGQVRTNEIALASPWEMREFRLDAISGLLKQTTTAQTPDVSFNKTATLDQFMLDNSSAILDGSYVVPSTMLSGAIQVVPTTKWKGVSGSTVPENVRHEFSLGTCNACHSGETGTLFTHISPRDLVSPAALSAFLIGDEVRRAADLKSLVVENLCTDQLVSRSARLKMPKYNRVH